MASSRRLVAGTAIHLNHGSIYWDEGSDTLWTDVPWDDSDLYGYTWHRVS
jgi:hypothetical protein